MAQIMNMVLLQSVLDSQGRQKEGNSLTPCPWLGTTDITLMTERHYGGF